MSTNEIKAAQAYIQAQHPGFPVPEKSYVILMAPRTGSTLLTTHLQQIDYGYPIEAFHFNHGSMRRQYGWEIDFNDPYAYMQKAIEFQMVNNISGVKLSWLQFQTFLKTARQITDPHNPDLSEIDLIRVFFPNLSILYMKRLDKVKQAISYSKGKQTGIWAVKVDQSDNYKNYVVPAVYDRAHIEGCLEELLAFDIAWENFLRLHRLDYLEIWYEDLAKDFLNEMARIYEFLGIERDKIPEPTLRKQSNTSSLEWASRFRAETPWLEEDRVFANAMQSGDFMTAYIQRSMRLITRKEEDRWREMPATRFKSIRKFVFRAQRKLSTSLKPKN